jgi:hypothetical protein
LARPLRRLLCRLLVRPLGLAGARSTGIFATVSIASLRPIAITCAIPIPIAYGGAIAISCSRAVAVRLEHLLAVLAAKILPPPLSGLNVGLSEFLTNIGIVVLHAVAVIRVVLPVAATDVGDVY